MSRPYDPFKTHVLTTTRSLFIRHAEIKYSPPWAERWGCPEAGRNMPLTLYISFKTYKTRLGNYAIARPAVNHYYRAGALSVSCAACPSECSSRKLETDKVRENDVSVWACAAVAQAYRKCLQRSMFADQNHRRICLSVWVCMGHSGMFVRPPFPSPASVLAWRQAVTGCNKWKWAARIRRDGLSTQVQKPCH